MGVVGPAFEERGEQVVDEGFVPGFFREEPELSAHGLQPMPCEPGWELSDGFLRQREGLR